LSYRPSDPITIKSSIKGSISIILISGSEVTKFLLTGTPPGPKIYFKP
jgi:hypothetical protein